MEPTKLIRPVKCHFCNQPMFYYGDERYDPEVHVNIEDRIAEVKSSFVAHIRCWNEKVGK